MSPVIDSRSGPGAGGPGPGNDPAALRFISAAVLAGLLVAGAAMAARGGLLPDGAARAGRAVRASRPVTAPVPAAIGSLRLGQSAGLRLLTQAARACQGVTYQGVEVAWWGPGEGNSSATDVWHRQGGQVLTRSAVAAAPVPGRPRQAGLFTGGGGVQSLDGAGVLDVSMRLAAMLGTNYLLAVTGWGQVADRTARIVTVRRPDGSLAAWFWLDAATDLPLRRQMFDTRARMISDVAFADVKIGTAVVASMPASVAQPWRDTLAPGQLARLRARGWPLPGVLPGSMRLLGAKEDTTPSGPVVDLDYSDGLSVVSVFVQRGHLPARLNGWSQVALEGHRVYTGDPDDHSVAWSARGFVFTLIAAAPRETVGQVVAALPHDDRPGLLTRIRHGLHRLLAWFGS
jgi:sigma-E factor negative regulatory protein RseB